MSSNPWPPVASGLAAVLCALSPVLGAGPQDAFRIGDLGHAIATCLIFLILLLVLGKWAWGPIVSQLRRREQSISAAIDQAEQREKHSHQLLALHKARLDQAETEAKEVLTNSRTEAAKARDEVVSAARDEGRQLIDRARRDIADAKQQALKDLQTTTAELAADIAQRLLHTALGSKEHEQLIARSLEEIQARAGEDS